MMKRRKKKRTFKPFGNPGRKLRTNAITSAPPMAIADRAPGISCSLSVCYSVCSCARLGDSGGGESLSENFSKEANALSVERKILSKREDISCVS